MKNKHSPLGAIGLVVASFGLLSSYSGAATLDYDGPEITFEQVYENPDDNALKLSYARQQAAAGDLLSAAGALEGMLYAQPNWDSARLFYAILLYELDDRASAEREFALLDGRPLSPEDRELVTRYRKSSAERETKGVTISGVVEVGVRIDSNAGNTLFNSTVDVNNEEDTSAFANGALYVTVPLTQTGGLKFHLGGRGQTRRHSTFSASDYDALGASAGLSGELSSLFWKADFDYETVFLSGEKYLTQLGPKLSVGAQISEKTRVTLTGTTYYQDFNSLSFSFGERFRSGNISNLGLSVFTRRNENLNFGATLGYENKNATQNSLAYDGILIGASAFKGFDNGLYINGNLRYKTLSFDSVNLITTPPIDRSDEQFTGRVGVGTSLNKALNVIGIAPQPILTTTYIEVSASYTDYNSNISIFDFSNRGAELKFIFDF